MKTILSGTLLLFLLATFQLSAQDVFKSGVTLKANLILPTGNFGNIDDFSKDASRDAVNGVDIGKALVGIEYDQAQAGFGFDVGQLFFFNKWQFHEKMRLGIDLNYMSFSYVPVKMKLAQNGEKFTGNYFYLGPEFGSMLSYKLQDEMALDFSVKFSPSINFFGASYTTTIGSGSAETEHSDFLGGIGFAGRFTPGLNFRYKIFSAGLNYSIGKAGMGINSREVSGDEIYTNVSSFNSLKLSLGVKF